MAEPDASRPPTQGPSAPPPSTPSHGHPEPPIIEQFLEMAAQVMRPPDPFLDKPSGPQIGKLLEQAAEASQREHVREMFSLRMKGWIVGGVLLLVFCLCWLFLFYGKSDQVEKIIALLIGLAGGIGIGRWTKE